MLRPLERKKRGDNSYTVINSILARHAILKL